MQDGLTATRDLLRVEGLRVSFPLLGGDLTAVDGASLRVLPGRITALVGESGSGKSITGQTIMGLQPSQARVSGRIWFNPGEGEAGGPPLDLLTLPRDGRQIRAIRGDRIGMIFQEPMTSFSALHTIGNQLSEALRLHRPLTKREDRERCEAMLARVGFGHPGRVFDMYPFELSGGMRQRAMIAMAAICGPDLLIADEPTTALDVTIQAQILGLIRDLQQELGMAVLLITHDLGVVANLADEVVVMHRGQVMEAGDTATIFHNPQHLYLRGLMQAVPVLGHAGRARLRPLREIPPDGIRELARLGRPEGRHEPSLRPLVSLREVSKAFLPRHQSWSLISSNAQPVTAVDRVSLDIMRGECLGLVGESGSGKTTIGKLLVRAMTPDAGTIIFDDGTEVIDIAEAQGPALDDLRSRVQMIFQDPVSSLSPRMTVGSILSEPLEIHRRGTPEERRRLVTALLSAIGLGQGAAARFPHSFSGGQRQRIGIARALALTPEFIICDEVVSALDVSVQAQILNLLKDLQRELHLTYLFISHDLGVVNYMADRIAVMWRGRLVEIGPRDLVMEAPVHPYTRALLAAIPVPDPARPLDPRARIPTARAEAEWPAVFREVPGQPARMVDLGAGHRVRMQELARPEQMFQQRASG
ncbi:ABC transporter ATP-binding protein [Paracoccus sp. PAR01]|uniref:dipeptide ABC transporter ATP-binding protein n=1 Tax=Paracoccus sp. PAR01 TaxID=2769282 RepID=UPI001CE099F8|nr:ABC transporter ATP-binding protein [Paracoccus sp. PAR01]